MKKAYIFFTILITILLLAGGYFAIQNKDTTPTPTTVPTPIVPPFSDPTATWKIYRNEKYKFEIAYPIGWLSREFQSNPGQIFGIVFYEKEQEEKSVAIEVYPSEESIENFIQRARGITSVKKLFVQGYPAALLGSEGAMGGSLRVFKDDRVFEITAHHTATDVWKQMYPTFQFLN